MSCINPETGKQIKVDGAVYKRLVASGVIKPGKVCPDGKVSNPRTGNCITINGKVYKEVMGASSKPKSPKAPKEVKAPKEAKAVKAVKAPKAPKEVKASKPKSPRLAPPEKAKLHANETKTGADGNKWKSSQIKNGTWRWVKVKVSASPTRASRSPSRASSRSSSHASSGPLKKRSHHKKTKIDTESEWIDVARRKGFFIKKKAFLELKKGQYQLSSYLEGSVPRNLKPISNTDIDKNKKFTTDDKGYLLYNGRLLMHQNHLLLMAPYPSI